MKKILFTIYCLFLLSFRSYGQQATQYSMYMLNPYAFNPAYGGLENSLEATGVFRQQWAGLDGAPTTVGIHIDAPVYIIHSGVGLDVENETIGAFRFSDLRLGYNYISKIGNGNLSLGFRAGFVQSSLDGSKLRTPDGNYNQGIIVHNDNTLLTNAATGMTPTFEAGVYYKSERFYAGAAASNISEPSLTYNGDKSLGFILKRNYFFNVGTAFDLKSLIKIHPSLLVKSDGTETQADFSAYAQYNENFFVGASFRGYNQSSKDAAVVFGGFKLTNRIVLAYSYDFTLSSLNTSSSGSHEIILQYKTDANFGRGKLPPIIYNPRF